VSDFTLDDFRKTVRAASQKDVLNEMRNGEKGTGTFIM
jgi:hypothetical protein